MAYRLSNAAAKDIEGILDRSAAEFGVLQTEVYFDSLVQCLEYLGDNPQMGSNANDIRPDYRRFPHASHVIFYTCREHEVLIVWSGPAMADTPKPQNEACSNAGATRPFTEMQSGNIATAALTASMQRRVQPNHQQQPESSRQRHHAARVDGKSLTELLAVQL